MDIVQMFQQRDNIFYNETKKILNEMTPVITGATSFIDDTYGMDDNRKLVWEGINLTDGIITLVGLVSYAPGTALMFEDEVTNITEDNSAYFQQMIRIGIPVEIALTQTADEVYDYLLSVQDNTIVEDDDIVEDGYNFDINALTDKQKQALITPTKVTLN